MFLSKTGETPPASHVFLSKTSETPPASRVFLSKTSETPPVSRMFLSKMSETPPASRMFLSKTSETPPASRLLLMISVLPAHRSHRFAKCRLNTVGDCACLFYIKTLRRGGQKPHYTCHSDDTKMSNNNRTCNMCLNR